MGGEYEKPITTKQAKASGKDITVGTGKGRIHTDTKTGMVHIHDDTSKLRCAVEPAVFATLIDWLQDPRDSKRLYDLQAGTVAVLFVESSAKDAGLDTDLAVRVQKVNLGDNFKAFYQHAQGK